MAPTQVKLGTKRKEDLWYGYSGVVVEFGEVVLAQG